MGLNADFIGSLVMKESADVRAIDDLVERLDKGEFDLIAVGRALLQDPQWPNKLREGQYQSIHNFDSESMTTLS